VGGGGMRAQGRPDSHSAGLAPLLSELRGVSSGAGRRARARPRPRGLRAAGGIAMTVRQWMAPVLLLLVLGAASEAAAQTHRLGDEAGDPDYVGRRGPG